MNNRGKISRRCSSIARKRFIQTRAREDRWGFDIFAQMAGVPVAVLNERSEFIDAVTVVSINGKGGGLRFDHKKRVVYYDPAM